MSENRSRYISTYDHEYRSEKAQRRGTGFIGILSDLDWMLSLELEAGMPLDGSKIVISQKIYAFKQGFFTGTSIHFLLIFATIFLSFIYIWTFKIENETTKHIIFLVFLLLAVFGKLSLAHWMINQYYIYPKGLTYVYLSWFIGGYTLGLLFPEIIYLAFISFFSITYEILKEPFMVYDWWKTVVKIIQTYFPYYADLKWLPLHYALIIVDFLPYLMLKWYAKKYPLEQVEWMPLDYIPKEDE